MTCTHGPEDLRHRGFKESGASEGVGCKGCNRDYHKRARDNAKQGLSACGHPLDRRRSRDRGEGRRPSTYCADCTNERQRMRRAEVQAGAERAPHGGGVWVIPGVAPSRELTAGAACGGDDRYTTPPQHLSQYDREDMAITCAGCPVVELCTVWAFKNPYFEGVAGGEAWWVHAKRRLHEPLTRYVVQEDPQEVSA